MMTSICKGCNLNGNGMIQIYQHPNKLDIMFGEVSGIFEILKSDALCINCYDEMKIAYNFKQKCLDTHFNRHQQHQPLKCNRIICVQREPSNVQVTTTTTTTTNELEHCIVESTTSGHLKSKDYYLDYDDVKSEIIISDELNGAFDLTVTDNEDATDSYADDSSAAADNTNDVDNNEEDAVDNDDDIETDVPPPIDESFKDDVEFIEGTNDDINYTDIELEPTERFENIVQLMEDDDNNFQNNVTNSKLYEEIFDIRENSTYILETDDDLSKASPKPPPPPPPSGVDDGRGRRGRKRKRLEYDIFSELKETQCEYCFMNFQSVDEMKRHSIDHENELKPFKCIQLDCKAKFKCRLSLRKHYQIHTAIKRFKCKYCDHRYHQRSNAIAHERCHTGEKPFLCSHCGKGFAENSNLKSHIRFHTGDRPYACTKCPKRFTTHYAHTIHERSHTNELPYLCNYCGRRFISSGKLLIHNRSHTGFRPYKCTECPANFTQNDALKRHTKTHKK